MQRNFMFAHFFVLDNLKKNLLDILRFFLNLGVICRF